jgi:antitoxin HigA-1
MKSLSSKRGNLVTLKRRPLERSPTPPSVQIRELILDIYDLTQDQLADALGVSRLTVNQLVNDRRSVTPDMAIRLEFLTGVSASHWLTLQQNYDLWRARQIGESEHRKIQRLPIRPAADIFQELSEKPQPHP